MLTVRVMSLLTPLTSWSVREANPLGPEQWVPAPPRLPRLVARLLQPGRPRLLPGHQQPPLRPDLCGEGDIQSQEGGGGDEGRQPTLPRQRVTHHRYRNSQGERLGLHEARHEAHLRKLEPLQIRTPAGLRHYQGVLCSWSSPACWHSRVTCQDV